MFKPVSDLIAFFLVYVFTFAICWKLISIGHWLLATVIFSLLILATKVKSVE